MPNMYVTVTDLGPERLYISPEVDRDADLHTILHVHHSQDFTDQHPGIKASRHVESIHKSGDAFLKVSTDYFSTEHWQGFMTLVDVADQGMFDGILEGWRSQPQQG
ncbi:MAG: hypothetical protein ACRDFX_06180 [Chloroflexota bacterium]